MLGLHSLAATCSVCMVMSTFMALHSHPLPHASCVSHHTLSPNPLCPHVLAPDCLTRWLTPFGIKHMNSLMNFFPPWLIAMSHLLSKSIALSTISNYSSDLMPFSQFCDDYHIPKSLHMLASESLLTSLLEYKQGNPCMSY